MNRTLSALLVSVGLAASGAPIGANAHDPEVLAGFIAGAAVGVLLTEAADGHHHHAYAYQEPVYLQAPVYVAPQPLAYYAVPAPRVRYYQVVEAPPRYHKPKHHRH